MKLSSFGAMLAAALVALVSPWVDAKVEAAKSFNTICDAGALQRNSDALRRSELQTEGGPLNLRPGRYFNAARAGQGWDFFWYGQSLEGQSGLNLNMVGNRLFVVWYTHEWVGSSPASRVLKPVWYGAVSSTAVWNTPTTALEGWSGRLYRFNLSDISATTGGVNTFRQWLPAILGAGGTGPQGEFATQVGEVELFFGAPGSGAGLVTGGRPSQVAARWKLNESYDLPPALESGGRPTTSDCLTNPIAAGQSLTPDYTRSGVYFENSAAGWFWTPIYWDAGTPPSVVKHEHHLLAYFDSDGKPRWIVGFPPRNIPVGADHACENFINRFGAQLTDWQDYPSLPNAMCMTGVNYPPVTQFPPEYVPWQTNRPYTLQVVAAMQRNLRETVGVPPSGSIGLRKLGDSLTFRNYSVANNPPRPPSFLQSGTGQLNSAQVVKVIGLTRAVIAGPGILSTGPYGEPLANPVCAVSKHNTQTPGTCDVTAHWSTEGAYLNLSVRLVRNDPSPFPLRANEVARGELRSVLSGVPLSRRLLGGNGGTISQPEPTFGPLVGDTIELQAFESPIATTPLARSVSYPVIAPYDSCREIDFIRPLQVIPIVSATTTGGGDGVAVQTTIPPPSDGVVARKPAGLRYRLYEASASSYVRFGGEQQFAIPQTALQTAHSTAFNGLELGKSYRVVVDVYNECGFQSAASSLVAVTQANVPDQSLVNSPAPVTTHDPTVGIVPQSTGVSGGAATFEFPIEVPPGIQGMQPSLSLSYSSRAGNGVAGMGVSLSGLSSIHRCPQTRATDGKPRPVDFSASDRLCLDGQRLIAVDGGAYGQTNTRYRTEIDQYLLVTQTAGDLGANSRAATFRAELKSGEVLHFGGTFGAFLSYVPVATTPNGAVNAALSWVIRRRANRAGNFVEYRYQDFGSGELQPAAILYSGTGSTEASGGVLGNREVRFTYQLRPDPTNSFIAGAETRQTQRLSTIKTFIGSVEVKAYNLGFGATPSANTGRSLLRDIQLCANGGGTSTCLPTTLIEWQEQNQLRNLRPITIGGSISTPLPYTPQQYFAPQRLGGGGGIPSAPVYSFDKLGDLDGDGTVEHIAYSGIVPDPSTIRSRLVRYSADRQVSGAIDLSPDDFDRLFSTARDESPDLNNDGRADLWYQSSRSSAEQLCIGTNPCALAVLQWIPGRTWPSPSSPSPPLSNFVTQRLVEFIDPSPAWADGSVRPPPEEIGPPPPPVLSGEAPQASGTEALPGSGAEVPEIGVNGTYFFDVTGDGLPDLFHVAIPTASIGWIGPSGIQTSCPQVAVGGTYLAPQMANGPELRVYENLSAGLNVRFKREPIVRYCIPRERGESSWSSIYVANFVSGMQDLNGDGLPDLKLLRRSNPEAFAALKNATVAFGNISSSVFSFGAAIEFRSLFAEQSLGDKLPVLDGFRSGDFNGDGLQDIHTFRTCVPRGGSSRATHLISFNTGKVGIGTLFTKFIATAGANGVAPSLDDCEQVEIGYQPGPNFLAVGDSDADGRDEVIYPTAFALRQCNWLPHPLTIRPGEVPIYRYFCPEGIRGGAPPQPDLGFNQGHKYEDSMYQNSYGSWDGSLYHASASRFVVTGSNSSRSLREEVLPSGVITSATGQRLSDLYGDSLPDSIVIARCGLVLDESAPSCVKANSLRDSAGNPVVSNSFYIHESRGVSGNPEDARALNRSPLLPDLVWQVKAGASTGHVDSAMRIARWSYDPLSSSAGRTTSATIPKLYELPSNLQAAPPAHFYFTSSMPVVASYWESNGNTAASVCQSSQQCPHGFVRKQFGYREALYSAEGRGFRGFRTITEQIDGLSPPDPTVVVTPGLRTTTVYKQSFPLSSAMECQFVTSTADPIGPVTCPATLPDSAASLGTTLLKASTAQTSALLRVCAAAGNPTCYWDIQTTRQDSVSYEPTDGRWVTKSTVNQAFDTYGNETSRSTSVTQIDALDRTVTQTQQVNSRFSPAASPFWFVNRLDATTTRNDVTYGGYNQPSVVPGASLKTSTALFAYDFNPSSGVGTRQVRCAETFLGETSPSLTCAAGVASNANWQSRVSTMTRDIYGNPTHIQTRLRSTSAPTGATEQIRDSHAAWGDGYFKVSETNALGHPTCYRYDARFGAPDRVSRPMTTAQTCSSLDLLVEETTYDPFGLVVRVKAPQTTEFVEGASVPRTIQAAQDVVVTRHWCKVGVSSPACSFLPLMFREMKEQRGSPRQETYYDAAARPRLVGTTASEDLSSTPGIYSLVSSSTVFDDLGRELGVYGPSRGGTGKSTDFYYDRFGRLRVKRDTRERLDDVSGNQHLATSYTADRATVEIKVRACSTTTINPDAIDPVVCGPLSSPATGTQTNITMSRVMDPAGRPLVTVDAKAGTTLFQYDGGGNPVSIRDTAQVVTRATYDDLGRRLQVNDPNQGESRFDYNGAGELVRSRTERGFNVRPAVAEQGPPFEVTFARDALGRVTQRNWFEPAGAQQSANYHYGIDRYDYDTNGLGLLWRERRDVYSSGNFIHPVNPAAPGAPLVESFERSMLFDPLYRPISVTTRPGTVGASGTTAPAVFVTRTRYDGGTGRVKQRIFPRDVSVGYTYNRHGYPETEFKPGTTGHYRKVVRRDDFGNEMALSLNDGNVRRQLIAATTSGLTKSICYDSVDANSSAACAVNALLNVHYRYDAFGNVQRQELRAGRPGGTGSPLLQEAYSYDELHRVGTAQYQDNGVSTTPVRYGYSGTGNLLKKTDYSVDYPDGGTPAYTYGTNRSSPSRAGPNAVVSVTTPSALSAPGKTCATNYLYDKSGNQVAQEFISCGAAPARRQWIDYTIDNLPKWMQTVPGAFPSADASTLDSSYPSSLSTSLSSQFRYSPDGQRYAQTVRMGNVSRSTVYVGEYEREEVIGGPQPYIEHRYSLASGVLVVEREADTGATPRSGAYYVLGDRLGSTSIVMRGRDRVVVDRHGFGPFGEPRDGNWVANATRTLHPVLNDADLSSPAITRRGFTQHEHLDRHSLIHMNGRLYDYLSGRFLGVDPVIQFPSNSQSLNAYSYILNNPLAGADPTGYQAEVTKGGCTAMTGTRICDVDTGAKGGVTSTSFTLTDSNGRRAQLTVANYSGGGTAATLTFSNGSDLMTPTGPSLDGVGDTPSYRIGEVRPTPFAQSVVHSTHQYMRTILPEGAYEIWSFFAGDVEAPLLALGDGAYGTAAIFAGLAILPDVVGEPAKGAIRVGRHGSMPSPRPEGMESHHGILDMWARNNISGYKRDDAPGVLMRADPSHNATRSVYNRWRAEIATRQGVDVRRIDWRNVSPGEMWRLAEEQFEAARIPVHHVEEYFRQFHRYLEELQQ